LQGFGGTPGDGRVYVIYGGSFSTAGTTPITLSTSASISSGIQISGASGFAIGGVSNEGLGRYLAAGDVNGDNKPDLVVNSIAGSGKDYVIFGRNANDTPFTNITTSQIQDSDGFVVTGTSGLPGITGRLSGPISVGDVNGDQIGDIIQTAHLARPKK